jgi:hypothetical protein
VVLWRIVGRGFVWLMAGTAGALGVSAFLLDPGPAVAAGVVAVLAGVALTGRSSAGAFAAGAVAFASGASHGGWLPAVTGAIALGGVTSEMMLGHWYLVDPRLPRWALRRLDGAGLVGVVADVAVVGFSGAFAFSGDSVAGWAFVIMGVFSAVLLVAVWFALGEEGYSGVMAATGLSYLAVLTVIGTALVGRSLV